MLARRGSLPTGVGWAFEVKWDGFRALVSTYGQRRVQSRRSWDMTKLVPELEGLPSGLVLSYREERVLGRPLTIDEAREFTNICRRLTEIVLLEPELDANYLAATGGGSQDPLWTVLAGRESARS
jgi:hypothetical protein